MRVGNHYPILFTAAVLACGVSLPVGAQPPPQPPPPCEAAEHRQFDFWVGNWEVHGAEGQLFGHNEITRVSRGCALLENWRGTSGSEGMSINAFERGRWTQRWVGAGAMLWLEGGLEEGKMVLTSPEKRDTPKGPVLDRITWTPLEGGRLQQSWDVSPDDGATWHRLFDGFYSRVDE